MTDRVVSLTKLLPSIGSLADYRAVCNPNGDGVRIQDPYYAGLHKAMTGNLSEAESLLMEAVTSPDGCRPDMESAATCALAEVYRCLAEQKLAEDDLGTAAGYLGQAQALDAGNVRIAFLMDTLGFALPVLHILSGKRDLARDAWIKALKEDPSNLRAAHSLALLYHYWAKEHLDAGRLPDAVEAWERSSECWSMVLSSPQFQDDWISTKAQVYGKRIEAKDIVAACAHASGVVLRTISDAASEFRSAGDDVSYRTAMHAYGVAIGELRAAELLAEAVNALGGEAPKSLCCGGPKALTRYGGMDAAQEIVLKAGKSSLDRTLVSRLEVVYSGRAPEWGLLEAKLFDQLVSELEAKKGRSPEQDNLLSQAYFELGVLTKSEAGSHASFDLWAKSLGCAAKQSAVREDIEKHAIAAAKVVIAQSKTLGITVLRTVVDDMKRLAKHISTNRFKTNLSTALRQLAIAESNADNTSRVKGLLEEALKYNQANQSAKRDLSIVLCGEAIEEANSAQSRFNSSGGYGRDSLKGEIRAAGQKLNKSLEMDPGNQHARQQYVALVGIMKQLDMYSEMLEAMTALKM